MGRPKLFSSVLRGNAHASGVPDNLRVAVQEATMRVNQLVERSSGDSIPISHDA